MKKHITFLISCLIACSICTSVQAEKDAGELFSALTNIVRNLTIDIEDEKEFGKAYYDSIISQYGVTTSASKTEEIEEIGNALIKNTKLRDQFDWKFVIIRKNEYNAYSAFGGQIFFTEKLWDELDKSARQGILAHEIAHSDKRHLKNSVKKSTVLDIFKSFANRNEALVEIGVQCSKMKYSREHEEEADKYAVDLCSKANYKPEGILRAMYMLERIYGRYEPEKGVNSFIVPLFYSHPPTPNRQAYLKDYLKEKNHYVPTESELNILLGE